MSGGRNKRQQGDKPQRRSDVRSDEYIMISKRHIYWALLLVIISLSVYYTEKNYRIKDKVLDIFNNKESIAPHQEYVDTSKEIPDFIQHYNEEESHPDPNVRHLPSDFSRWPPGEMGLGVNLVDGAMSNQEKAKRKEMYNNHAFEEYVSELIALNRSLPDFRGQWCRDQYDGKLDHLEKASIIICFHNEAWSTLMRSVHSIVNRTPRKLIEEILLVDDKSDKPHLGQRLDDYVEATFPKGLVKVIRQEKRQGLMRSRMTGIRASKAKVLVFLDSHIEAGIGWLEPMLADIERNPQLITSPVIDAINDNTFYYKFIEKDIYGLMNWRMEFEWHELSVEDQELKSNIWAPHVNPIMAGGLFAIRKDFFEKLGYYDEGMEVWGGENFELSFKAWMCGGRIEIAPCSRVGHVFRSWSPYKVEEKNINHNLIRLAEVWMDDFKYLFYSRLGKFDSPLSERLGNVGDLSDRIALRKSLNCKPFKWYWDEIVKNRMAYHTLIGAGEVRNAVTDLCFDKNDRTEHMDEPIDLLPCHNLGGNQYWWFNNNR